MAESSCISADSNATEQTVKCSKDNILTTFHTVADYITKQNPFSSAATVTKYEKYILHMFISGWNRTETKPQT